MPTKRKSSKTNTVYLIANGDLRASANQNCEKEQLAMEAELIKAIKAEGFKVKRAHKYRPEVGHSFIDSQKYGMEVFRSIPENAPLVVAEAVWQYSHHVLHGLMTHQGPILTVANWSGTWPGLVGMLNLNGSLTKAGVEYSTLWSEDFTNDRAFRTKLRTWLSGSPVKHRTPHVKSYRAAKVPKAFENLGKKFAAEVKKKKMIMGVFDEGCMGMFNAIIPDHLLNPTGVFKERLSQSSLYAKMQTVTDKEAKEVYAWYKKKGLQFKFGKKEASELTEKQVLQQCKMYIAALRIADEFGCDCIGIQYQQGLKDLSPASDLVEGSLNNVERPPVKHEATGQLLYKGEALPHFNEVDECAGLDGLITYHLWRKLGLPPENTLHDLRWGRQYKDGKMDDYVWVFLISGAAPPAHHIGGWKGSSSERQPPMYFRLGGGTLKGIAKPGWIVWSRVYVAEGKLKFDTGLAQVVKLPAEETEERWQETTPQWPIMHAVLQGISRDQMMARHQSNHIQVAYGKDKASARKAMFAKGAAMKELGLEVAFCGDC